MACLQAMEKIEMVSSLKLDHGYKLPKMKYKKTDGADKPPVLCVRGQSGESVNGRVRPDPSKASSDVGQGEGTHAAGARQAISSAEDDKQRVASSSGIANPSGQGKRSAFAFGQGKPPSEKAASTSAVLVGTAC